MVGVMAVIAAVVATMFAQATSVRLHQRREPHELAWTLALVMFAFAAVALFLGDTTGWDSGTYRAFYLFGAILNVPWLALGTVYLFVPPRAAHRVRAGVVFFSGMALGTMLATPIRGTLPTDAIPDGSDHFGALPRILAGVGSGLGATILIVGAVVSAVRALRRVEREGATARRLGLANVLIATGTLIVSAGGTVQGWLGIDADEAFALCTALGICVIYAGFWTASSRAVSRSARRSTLPANV
jgi:hypothetical protein